MTKVLDIENWLRQAYVSDSDCPPPETYLKDSLERMSSEAREAVLAHGARCPACAAELDLARAYDASPQEMSQQRADVDFVVSRLQSPLTSEPRATAPSAVVRPRLRSHWGLAAAAVFIFALVGAVTLLRSPAPSLPDRADAPVMRGTRVEIQSPVGGLDVMPTVLRWIETPQAQIYRVRLIRVDESILAQYVVKDTHVDLPEELLGQLRPAVTYYWEVEALDSGETRIALSDRVQFRVNPGPE